MSVVADAESRARTEIEGSPSVFSILCEEPRTATLLGTLCTVRLPQDLGRFRLRDDGEGFDVLFKLRGRWHRVDAAWRQLKGGDLDPVESRPVAVVPFGRRILKDYGVRHRKERLVKMAEYTKAHKEEKRKYDRIYRQLNREKRKERMKAWRQRESETMKK